MGLSIFVLLIAVYSLTYSGAFITDDEHILASRTLSLAFDEDINDSRAFGNSRVYALADTRADYAAQGTNIEPAQALLGAGLARLSVWMGTGRVQTIFLLSIWVTALTAAILFGVILFLGYSQSVACIAALLFGLGTIAWPYSRSYFRDPLAMLFLTIAWGCTLIVSRNGFRGSRVQYRLIWMTLIGSLLAGILTKNTVMLALPVLVIYLIHAKYKDTAISLKNALREHWRKLVFSIAAALLVSILWIVLLPPEGIFARFTFAYYRSVLQAFLTRPHSAFLPAIAGPIFSPGKSILIFSPILFLSFLKRNKGWDLACAAWSYLFLLIVGQALFYDSDWAGHINWGLRFVLPAVPALMVAAAPVIEGWLTTSTGCRGLLAIGAISVLIQLAGVLAPIHRYYVELSSAGPSIPASAMIWNLKYSALLWHVKWIVSGGAWDLAAVRVGLNALPVLLGFLMIIGVVVFWWRRAADPRIPSLALIFAAALTGWMLLSYRDDSAYFRSRADLQAAHDKIRAELSAGDLVIVKSYGTAAWLYWMNWADPAMQWISLPFSFPAPALLEEYNSTHDPEVAMDEMTLSLLRGIPSTYERVWIVLPSDSPGADLNLEADWLEERSASSYSWSFSGDGTQTWLYLFEFASGIRP